LSHFWPLQRDRERLAQARQRVASLPLGSGALAGVPLEVDRPALADKLGFAEASPNSLDAVSDRDFVAEFLFCAAMIGIHLSRLAEDVVLFSSAEFGYFELSDAYATGSSLMPQKKNPDVFELTRGKAGTLLGYLTALLAVLKGLPSGYDKDLQEDKQPLFAAYDTLMAILPVLADALRSLAVRADRMRDAIDAGLMATDLADYFVNKGLPFRQAHALVGKLVQLAQSQGKALNSLSLEEIRSWVEPEINLEIEPAIYSVFDPVQSVTRRRSLGGTAPQAVRRQLEQAKQVSGRF
jgi:argininosuccinate lyase